MNKHSLYFSFPVRLRLCALLCAVLCLAVAAQAQNEKPLTSQELVKLVYQLPQHPERRDEVVEEIRRRGIGFELTEGMRSVVASKSGNDALIRHTLEEAERRRANPVAVVRPNEPEARDVLERTRKATLAAAAAMPDFVVRQLIARYQARGTTHSWEPLDHLTVAVSYRESTGGEQYKLLAVNGVPEANAAQERYTYKQAGGATTTGEFASLLVKIFSEKTGTEFAFADTDTLRGRRAFVYEFKIKREAADEGITYNDERTVTTGLSGRAWVDVEEARVLRLELTYTEIEPDFPVKSLEKRVDYDWVTIAERKYLLPVSAESVFTTSALVTYYDPRREGRVTDMQTFQNRNEIRFRNYQRFGAKVEIIEEGDFEEETPKEPPKKKPE